MLLLCNELQVMTHYFLATYARTYTAHIYEINIHFMTMTQKTHFFVLFLVGRNNLDICTNIIHHARTVI